jgi:hypothetical protein
VSSAIVWSDYFRQFSLVHGGNPVIYKRNPESGTGGMLLFPDGWMYSAGNMRGPEFPPPKDRDKHLALIRDYWNIKLSVLKEELRRRVEEIRDLVSTQSRLSAPLSVYRRVLEEGVTGEETVVNRLMPIDFQSLMDNVRQIREDLLDCQRNLDDSVIPDSYPVVMDGTAILEELDSITSDFVPKTGRTV